MKILVLFSEMGMTKKETGWARGKKTGRLEMFCLDTAGGNPY